MKKRSSDALLASDIFIFISIPNSSSYSFLFFSPTIPPKCSENFTTVFLKFSKIP